LGRPISLANSPDLKHSHAAYLSEAEGNYENRAYDYVTTGVGPYWQLAAQYGWANRMFQTNQGPSFPAHLFLLTGTSSPLDTSPEFVSDNPVVGSAGCRARPGSLVPLIEPNGSYGSIYPCFTTSSMIDLLAAKGLSWRYYCACGHQIWNAPGAIENWYQSPEIINDPPQVLRDIARGNLADVSWVTPAEVYSDHPGLGGGGPAWVSSIVNAVGQSPYWKNTAIIVTWDDWGGWWDHVGPGPNHTDWCTDYCYGFRVPLLVISASTPRGYVDNSPHDFGSILHFIESNFDLGNIGPGGWADSHADNLSEFFTKTDAPRDFVKIKSRSLTKAELADVDPPDAD
jgi:phospholipase C